MGIQRGGKTNRESFHKKDGAGEGVSLSFSFFFFLQNAKCLEKAENCDNREQQAADRNHQSLSLWKDGPPEGTGGKKKRRTHLQRFSRLDFGFDFSQGT